jgi:hypothetical protein
MLAGNGLFPGWATGLDGLPLEHGWLPFLAAALTMTLVYAASLAAMRILGREDLRLLRALIRLGPS